MTTVSLREEWTPPPRPEWVQRLNAEGECMAISEVVPLDEASLIGHAMRATGLSDFGDDSWREPFQVLLRSLEEDARLTLTGRLRMRAELLQLLEARLQVEDTYRRHPEIDEQEIVKPIIVAGQARTGSSFLINLLAANPEDKALLHWEAVMPCPPPEAATYATDPRIELADRRVTHWNRTTPTVVSIHEFSARLSMECCQVIAMNFMSPGMFGMYANIPGFDAYFAGIDSTPGIRYHKRVLKLLQWKNPRRHWVLKENAHLFRLPTMFEVYPDACFVWSHRDPVRAVASAMSAMATFQWGGTDHPLAGGALAENTDPAGAAAALDMIIDQIETGRVPAARFHHVQYRDLVRDPLGTVAGIYARFDIPFPEASRRAIAQYLADNPRDARPSHRLGLPEDAILAARQAFGRYQSYFGVPNE